MAKSKKDTPADKVGTDDSLPEVDTLTSGADAAEDSLAAEGGQETITAAEADKVAAAEDVEPAAETGDPSDTDPDADQVFDKAEDSVPHDGGDLASGAADDRVAPDLTEPADDTLAAEMAAPAPEPQAVRETVVERKGGFVPMLLGGVVAAGIGFVAGSYPDLPFMGSGAAEEDPFVTETRAALRSQVEQIENLAKRAADTDKALGGIDIAPLGTSVTALETGLADLRTKMTAVDDNLTRVGQQLGALDTRLTALEKQPLADAVSPEAIAAYERELDALKAQIAAQQGTMAAARKEVEAMAARAREAEVSAETRAKLAASRAALADLTVRARDGRPYAEPLAVLNANGVAVPAALSGGADEGLPTVSTLISTFPDAARDALSAARAAGADGTEAGGVGGFFRTQLGARSVTPRAGDDPDAVLSRAEAALRGGDLNTTLAEIETLPDVARDKLSDWVALATLRRDALAAAADLAQQLNQE